MADFSTHRKLLPALLEVQKELKPLLKTKQAYGYKHAELADVIDKVQGALNAKGILVMQCLAPSARPGIATLVTRLIHAESGEEESDTAEIPSEPGKGMSAAQGYGSAITYGRRYALLAMMGVATEDDDGAGGGVEPKKPLATAGTVTKISDSQRTKAAVKIEETRKVLMPLDDFEKATWLGNNPKEVTSLKWIKKNFPELLSPLTDLGVSV